MIAFKNVNLIALAASYLHAKILVCNLDAEISRRRSNNIVFEKSKSSDVMEKVKLKVVKKKISLSLQWRSLVINSEGKSKADHRNNSKCVTRPCSANFFSNVTKK